MSFSPAAYQNHSHFVSLQVLILSPAHQKHIFECLYQSSKSFSDSIYVYYISGGSFKGAMTTFNLCLVGSCTLKPQQILVRGSNKENFIHSFFYFWVGRCSKTLMTGTTGNNVLVLFSLGPVIKWLLIWESGWVYPVSQLKSREFFSQQVKFWPILCYQIKPSRPTYYMVDPTMLLLHN